MWLVGRFLLWFQILTIVSHAVQLNESKTYELKVSERDPVVKICGRSTTGAATKVCFGGSPNENQRHGCPENFCGITAETESENYLAAKFGGGNANFDTDCATIKLPKDKQIAIGSNAGNPKQGTCKWKADEDGKLVVEVTLLTNFTVEIEHVEFYNSVKSSTAGNVEWYYIAGPIAAFLLLIAIVVWVYCYCKKKKKDPEVKKNEEKKDDKEIPEVVVTPKPNESKTSDVNIIDTRKKRTQSEVEPRSKHTPSKVRKYGKHEIENMEVKVELEAVTPVATTPTVKKCPEQKATPVKTDGGKITPTKLPGNVTPKTPPIPAAIVENHQKQVEPPKEKKEERVKSGKQVSQKKSQIEIAMDRPFVFGNAKGEAIEMELEEDDTQESEIDQEVRDSLINAILAGNEELRSVDGTRKEEEKKHSLMCVLTKPIKRFGKYMKRRMSRMIFGRQNSETEEQRTVEERPRNDVEEFYPQLGNSGATRPNISTALIDGTFA